MIDGPRTQRARRASSPGASADESLEGAFVSGTRIAVISRGSPWNSVSCHRCPVWRWAACSPPRRSPPSRRPKPPPRARRRFRW